MTFQSYIEDVSVGNLDIEEVKEFPIFSFNWMQYEVGLT